MYNIVRTIAVAFLSQCLWFGVALSWYKKWYSAREVFLCLRQVKLSGIAGVYKYLSDIIGVNIGLIY
jgi:hypothetical protein